jgi:hypothetical protein
MALAKVSFQKDPESSWIRGHWGPSPQWGGFKMNYPHFLAGIKKEFLGGCKDPSKAYLSDMAKCT